MELAATRYAVDRGIATIELHRPHRRNAWTGRMHHEVRWSLQQAEHDPAVGAIVITGAGDAFCVGADFAALDGHAEKGGYDSGTPAELPTPGQGVHPAFAEHFSYLFGIGKPVVAAVNGPCAGVGLVLACYCDLRYAVPGAKLTTAHGKWNLPAEYGLSWLLPRLIGLSRATELLLTSRVFTAEQAEAFGLVHGIVAADELVDTVRAIVGNLIAEISPGSLRATKHQLYLDQHRDVGAAVRHGNDLLATMTTEADYVEAVRARNDARPPSWTGRTP